MPDQDAAQEKIIEQFSFAGHDMVEVTGDSRLRRFVLPVVGVTSDGTAEPLGTAFCVCSEPPVLLTAWHVVEEFILCNRADLERGPAAIVVVLELGQPEADGVTDRGRPIHVLNAVHHRGSKVPRGAEWLGPAQPSEKGFQSDVALLVLPSVLDSDGRPFCPDQVGIGFGLPDPKEWTYAIGYPELCVSVVSDSRGNHGLEVNRKLKRSAGHVVQSFPDGPPDEPFVNGPSFVADLAMPWGMSGGPVLTDNESVCAIVSRALDPQEPDGSWTSHAVGLAPALDLPTHHEPGVGPLTLRGLIAAGAVVTLGGLPAAPPSAPDPEVFTFAMPGG